VTRLRTDAAPRKRSYDRLCPLSLALDQIGDRWTLHVALALMSGPKRYTELKRHLSGAGANVLSDRLRQLSNDKLVGRSTGDTPGSETTYHLTARGFELAPVISSLAVWGLALLVPAPGADIEPVEFDQTWTPNTGSGSREETYRWRVDDVEFDLISKGSKLTRDKAKTRRPEVTFQTRFTVLADIVRGQVTVQDALERGDVLLEGTQAAIRRMFAIVGFPLARLGF
jgi:DNA-binding HxlR family transcriptional regulator